MTLFFLTPFFIFFFILLSKFDVFKAIFYLLYENKIISNNFLTFLSNFDNNICEILIAFLILFFPFIASIFIYFQVNGLIK